MTRNRAHWLIWAAVGVGLLLRGYHYARKPAVWHDEAALIVNVLKLPVHDSLGPLLHDEASPPLFLLLEKAVVAVLGDGEYALRLPSFAAACAAVVFTAFAARRLLPPAWAAVAVGLVAVSDRLLWHACEAKWYSVDVCVAAGALWAVAATSHWPVWKRSLLGAAVAPACVWVSFPACFVFGGVLTALLPAAWESNRRGRTAYTAFALAVGVSFVLLAVGPAQAQRTEKMNDCWGPGCFADWSKPAEVPVWQVVNSFEVARYCFMPQGWLLLFPAGVGGAVLLRKPDGWTTLCTTALPMLLALVAGTLGKYPYLASRTTAFTTPGLAVLAAAGLAQLWEWYWPSRVWRWGLLFWVPVLLLPAGYTAYRVVVPWNRAETDRAAAFVLAERAVGEPVYTNHWEYEYYFRQVDPAELQMIHQYTPGPHWDEWSRGWAASARRPRLWVLHQQDDLPDRELYHPPTGYRVKSVRDFHAVRVWELVPNEPRPPEGED